MAHIAKRKTVPRVSARHSAHFYPSETGYRGVQATHEYSTPRQPNGTHSRCDAPDALGRKPRTKPARGHALRRGKVGDVIRGRTCLPQL